MKNNILYALSFINLGGAGFNLYAMIYIFHYDKLPEATEPLLVNVFKLYGLILVPIIALGSVAMMWKGSKSTSSNSMGWGLMGIASLGFCMIFAYYLNALSF